jgi:hypothetical protein
MYESQTKSNIQLLVQAKMIKVKNEVAKQHYSYSFQKVNYSNT